MPTVPSYGPRKVEQERLPNARQSGPGGAVETPQSEGAAVGGALANLGQVGGKLALEAREIHHEQLDKAIQIQVRDADNALAAFEIDRRADPTDGWLTHRGTDALAVPDLVQREMEAKAGTIRNALPGEAQRQLFDRAVAQRLLDSDRWSHEYMSGQVQQHDDQAHRSFVDNAVQNGIALSTDPERLAIEHARIVEETQAWGARNGWAPEAVTAETHKSLTQLHTGVIHQWLAADRDTQARAYFDRWKDEIDGAAQPGLTAALDESTLRGASQREADRILAGGGDTDAQRAQARQIADPKLRDATMERIEHEATFQQRKATAVHDDLMRRAVNTIDQSADWRTIPSTDWVQLTLPDRASLKTYAEQMNAGGEVKTDPNTYYWLTTLATAPDPELRTQFLKTNILSFADRLSPADRKHFMDAQGAARQGDAEKGVALFSSAAQQNAIVDEALTAMRLDPTPAQPGAKAFDAKNAERAGMFRQAVREAVRRVEVGKGGKAATDDEVQSVVDQLRTPTGPRLVTAGTWHSRDVTAPGYAFETAQAQAARVSDIPSSERRKVEQALRDGGRSVNDHNVLLLFNLNLARTRKDLGPEDFAQRRRAVLQEMDDFERRRRDLGTVVNRLP